MLVGKINKTNRTMKKIGLLLGIMLSAVVTFAQEEKTADQYKNEGNEYVRNKSYAQALASYREALKLWGDAVDTATVFNAGMCAQNVKDLDAALVYYKRSADLGYKKAEASYRIALIYKGQKKEKEYLEALNSGYENFKTGKTADLFAKELGKYYRDKGNAIYKEAADIIAKTQTVTDAKQMDKLKAQAKAKFMEAKPLIEKAIEIYPKDKNSKAILEGIEKNVASL